MEILGVLILALVIIFGAARDWKLSTKAILVLVVIEGGLRRWAFPQARDLIYFFKDLILIGCYIGFSNYRYRLIDRYPFIKELTLVIAIFCCLQAFNPSLGSPLVGLLGVRCYLLYIPLVWVIPHLFDSQDDLLKFLRNYLFLLIPVCILGIVQYFSPPSSPLNVYIEGEDGYVATVGEFVRITGTFSYLVGLTTYLAVCFSLLIVLITQERKVLWQLIYILELLLVVINSLMSGARAIISYELLFVICYPVLLFWTSPKNAVNFVGRLFLPVIVGTIITVIYFQPAVDAFMGRATNSDSFEERVVSSFTQVFDYAAIRWDGYGAGATQSGANSLRNILNLPAGEALPPNEGETGRVVIEIGILGFVLWYGLRILLLMSIFSVYLRLKNPTYKEIALAIFLFQLINLTGQLVTNPTMLVYFWFFSGFIYLLPILEYKSAHTIDISPSRDVQ